MTVHEQAALCDLVYLHTVQTSECVREGVRVEVLSQCVVQLDSRLGARVVEARRQRTAQRHHGGGREGPRGVLPARRLPARSLQRHLLAQRGSAERPARTGSIRTGGHDRTDEDSDDEAEGERGGRRSTRELSTG